MHENQKWVFQQCVKAYFFRKFADPGGGGMGVPSPSFQLKKSNETRQRRKKRVKSEKQLYILQIV